MRYYAIQAGGYSWSSLVNGANDPAALDIELDILIAPNGQLINGWVKIYGIPQSLISQSTNFYNLPIQIFGGMYADPSSGLYLAKIEAPHAGNLLTGTIFAPMGNWIGNELSLEFVIQPPGNAGGPTSPKNVIHNMPQGTSLSSAIKNALSTAFPGIPVNVNISPNLVLNYPDQGFHQNLQQYQNYIKALSHDILGTPSVTGYQGVQVDTSKGQINVFDGTVSAGAIELLYEDLIGQPTWTGQSPPEIQVKTVMRSDITPGTANGASYITLPQGILVASSADVYMNFYGGSTSIAAQAGQVGDVLTFQGSFQVRSVRHVGKFRQSTGEAWVSIITLIPPIGNTVGGIINQSGQQIFNSIAGGI
jgi:hypothetical protein